MARAFEAKPKEVAKNQSWQVLVMPFSSSQTSSVVELLKQAELSMVISTYKSGHVDCGKSWKMKL